MQVKLLTYTPEPQRLIYASARQCYSKSAAASVWEKAEKVPSHKIKKFVNNLVQRGHLSPFEHINFTFAIEGISRVCTHQLVRHRIASYSQQSQRYVAMDSFSFIIPPSIAKNREAKKIFLAAVETIKDSYQKLKCVMEKKGEKEKELLNQDLRFLLPQAVETKIVVTMNVRELLHFFSERLCSRAQWEIRSLALKMLTLCKKVFPEVFATSGPKCKQLRYCPDNHHTCVVYKKYFGGNK